MITKNTMLDVVHDTVLAWKCYRCNLYFKDEAHAYMHKVVMNHPVVKIQLTGVAQRAGLEPTSSQGKGFSIR